MSSRGGRSRNPRAEGAEPGEENDGVVNRERRPGPESDSDEGSRCSWIVVMMVIQVRSMIGR